jgi:alkylation response protein AidB-like acyl-CoA dehydrogenase
MDLELTDEQGWLSESVLTLLAREWVDVQEVAAAGSAERERCWRALVDFGALDVGDDEGLGAVELCLIARALGRHLVSAPYLGSAALRYAAPTVLEDLPGSFADVDGAVSLALLEPGGGWDLAGASTTLDGNAVTGEKVAVEHAAAVPLLAVVAEAEGAPALALVGTGLPGVTMEEQPSLDTTVPMYRVHFGGVDIPASSVARGEAAQALIARLAAIGSLMAAAEAVGAAERTLEDACAYAAERRQFGRTIGSFQALRHLLSDMHVRGVSAWSTVLFAAASLDDGAIDAPRTASIAKAYVSRAAREVAHGAIQVFGGVAFTAEHPAHRYLRRIIVREQQFGDANHHERALGRAFATGLRQDVRS